MNGRERLTFNPVSHAYMFDGMRVPSVTQVLKFIDGMENVPPDRLMVAGARGSAVHRATEQLDLGKPWGTKWDDAMREECGPYVSAYLTFLSDYRDALAIETVEEKVYHPLHQYAGTADRVFLFEGERAVFDLKTSVKLGPAVGPQLAAYQEALNAHRPAKERVVQRYALQLRKDGTYVLRQYWEHGDFAVFLNCLGIYRWRIDKGMGELARPSSIRLPTGYELTDGHWPLRPVQEALPEPDDPKPITLYRTPANTRRNRHAVE